MSAQYITSHPALSVADCPLCQSAGGDVVFQNSVLRIVHVREQGFAAFYRVVWNAHVQEWSDLSQADRIYGMEAVVLLERALRQFLQPRKINLATLGNVVPHLHWHVIARFDWDSHFPAPVWAQPARPVDTTAYQRHCQSVEAALPDVHGHLHEALAAAGY